MTEAPEGDVPRGLVRSSGVMAAGTVVSRALGFARNTVLAAAIGTDLVATTYNVANTIPNILYILIAGGVLNAVFVPQLVRAMKHGDGGQGYTDRLLTLAGLVLLGLTILATVAAPLLIALYTPSNWGDEDVATATAFAFWCLPQIAFYGLYAMLGQVLNARGSFGPMMWAPIVNNLVAIATGLLFIAMFTVDFKDPGSVSAAGIAVLGCGATLGVALQALVLVPVLRRFEKRFRDSNSEEGTVMATVLAFAIDDAMSSGRREILSAFRADEEVRTLFDRGLLERVNANLTLLSCSPDATATVTATDPDRSHC